MQDDRYFSKSWAMLTKEQGWIKPLLVLTVAMLVPVAGPLAVSGYILDWARLTAWGAETSPKRKGIQVGELICVGWRGFCSSILWNLVWLLVVSGVVALFFLLLGVTGANIAWLLTGAASLFFTMVVNVAVMRAVIYTKATAALNPSRVFELIGRDPKGLFKIVLIPFLGSLVVLAVCVVMYLVILALVASDAFTLYTAAMRASRGLPVRVDTTSVIIGMVLKGIVPALLFGYAMGVITVAVNMLTMNSVALWIRQFNVAAWGGPNDPLPPAQPVLPPAGGAAQGAVYQQDAPTVQQPVAQQQIFTQQPTPAPQQVAPQPVVQESVAAPVPQQPTPAPAPQQPSPQGPGQPQVPGVPQAAGVPQQPDVPSQVTREEPPSATAGSQETQSAE